VIEKGPATTDEVIGAFLRAEIDSSRYSLCINQTLTSLGSTAQIIYSPDITNTSENDIRRMVLSACRGYPDRLLYQGFPSDVTWRRVQLMSDDFENLLNANVANSQFLLGLSRTTRRVAEAAKNYANDPITPETQHLPGVLAALRSGKAFDPLIAAEAPGGPLVLMEGHSRAIAYAIEDRTDDVAAFVGTSPLMVEWAYY
jgi:hypothetical protein